jgi:hypothetical protein
MSTRVASRYPVNPNPPPHWPVPVPTCQAISATAVSCDPNYGVRRISTGDGTDSVTIDGSVPAEYGWQINAWVVGPDEEHPEGADGSGTKTFTGGAGPDEIDGGSGNDVIEGRGGNDMVHGRQGDDRVAGGDGDDTVYVWGYGTFNDPDQPSNPVTRGVLDSSVSCGSGNDWARRPSGLIPGPDMLVNALPRDCEGSDVLWRAKPVITGKLRVGQTLRVAPLKFEGGPYTKLSVEWKTCPRGARVVSPKCYERYTRSLTHKVSRRDVGKRIRVKIRVDASLYGRYNGEEHWSQVAEFSNWTGYVKAAR